MPIYHLWSWMTLKGQIQGIQLQRTSHISKDLGQYRTLTNMMLRVKFQNGMSPSRKLASELRWQGDCNLNTPTQPFAYRNFGLVKQAP